MGRLRERMPEKNIIRDTEFAKRFTTIVQRDPYFRRIYQNFVYKVLKLEKESDKVLVIDSSPGFLSILLAKENDKFEITDLSLSEGMITIAKENAEQNGVINRINWKVGDAEDIPFNNSTFDLVISMNSLHHWRNPVRCFNEINRVLKVEGCLLLCDLRRDFSKIGALIVWMADKWGSKGEFMNSIRASYTVSEVQQLFAMSEFSEWDVKIADILRLFIKSKKGVIEK
ncbi:MAG: class I SAM-dependent methyltransferase [bacterium]